MNAPRYIIIFLFLVLSRFVPACSMSSDYIPPSNYMLVKEADAIVIVEAVKTKKISEDLYDIDSGLVFKIEEILKGKIYIQKLMLPGETVEYMGRSAMDDFSKARPGAYAGACIALDYKIGKKYLLFLNEKDDNWNLLWHAFSRINEEVSGMNEPWVRAVKQYITIDSLNSPAEEIKKLLEVLEYQSNESNTGIIPGLAKDIEDHFTYPSEYMTTSELIHSSLPVF